MMKQKCAQYLSLYFLILLMLSGGRVFGEFEDEKLVFHNTLNSLSEMQNSVVGLNPVVTGTPKFASMGGGFNGVALNDVNTQIFLSKPFGTRFPSKGSIEFYWKPQYDENTNQDNYLLERFPFAMQSALPDPKTINWHKFKFHMGYRSFGSRKNKTFISISAYDDAPQGSSISGGGLYDLNFVAGQVMHVKIAWDTEGKDDCLSLYIDGVKKSSEQKLDRKVIHLIQKYILNGDEYDIELLRYSKRSDGAKTQFSSEQYVGNFKIFRGERWIYDAVQFQQSISEDLCGDYLLMNDIDLDQVAFTSIGTVANPFKGTLNGNGFAIKNLKITKPNEGRIGLFKTIENAQIKNLSLVNADVSGWAECGILAGWALISAIENITVSQSKVSGNGLVGGIAGLSFGTDIAKSSLFHIDVKTSQKGGGIFGEARESLVSECFLDDIDVEGQSEVGGLVGYSFESEFGKNILKGITIYGSDYLGGVIGVAETTVVYQTGIDCVNILGQETKYCGGFAGYLFGSKITDSYCLEASLTGNLIAGVFCSSLSYGSQIKNCYVTGKYTSILAVSKPFMGQIQDSSTTGCYWNKDIFNNANANEPNAKGLTNDQMKEKGSFLGWDFSNTWIMLSRPRLRSEKKFEIYTIDDLKNINNGLDYHYVLMNDIDLTGVAFTPIGTAENPFKGTFNGNGFAIKKLKISKTTESNIGLFGVIQDAQIKNLSIANADVAGKSNVGVLSGSSLNSILNGINIIDSKVGGEIVGGAIGIAENSIIEESSIKICQIGNITLISGGFIGLSNNNTINKVVGFNNKLVGQCNGGVIGLVNLDSTVSQSAIIENTFELRLVGGAEGGIIGETHAKVTIDDSYVFQGAFSGTNVTAGGIIGNSYGPFIISRVYSSINFLSNTTGRYGGFIGNANFFPDSAFSDCFWNCELDSIKKSIGNQTQDQLGVTPVTNEELQTEKTFSNWNFTLVWEMCDYPRLRFEGWKGIENLNEIANMNNSNELFYLKNDIDGGAWPQIENFSGILYGNGHTIKNIKIGDETSPDEITGLGLFKELNGATIKDLKIENVHIVQKTSYAGILASKALNSNVINIEILDCSIKKAGDISGGIIGYFSGDLGECSISDSKVENFVIEGNSNIGGLVGNLFNSNIVKCYLKNSLLIGSHSGGLVGGSENSIISKSYVIISKIKGEFIGGILGSGNKVDIKESYILDSLLDGISYVGGLTGYSIFDGIITEYKNNYIHTFNNKGLLNENIVGRVYGQLPQVNNNFIFVSPDSEKVKGKENLISTENGVTYLTVNAITDNPTHPNNDPNYIFKPFFAEKDSPWTRLGFPRLKHEKIFAISNIYDLQGIQNAHEKDFYLISDIDASVTKSWNNGKGFTPIKNFSGTLDGNGKIVDGLFIDRRKTEDFENSSDCNDVGLFSNTQSGSSIQKLLLENIFVGGVNNVGGICGQNGGTIEQSRANGVVKGKECVGGLTGINKGKIENCYTNVQVACDQNGGGIAGSSEGSIAYTYTIGSVSGSSVIGGICGGRGDNSTFTNNFWLQKEGFTYDLYDGGGVKKSEQELQSETTFTGWSFKGVDAIWELQRYPQFKFEELAVYFGSYIKADDYLNPETNEPAYILDEDPRDKNDNYSQCRSSDKAMYVSEADKILTKDKGYIWVVWKIKNSNEFKVVRFLIKNEADPSTNPVALYHTHFNEGIIAPSTQLTDPANTDPSNLLGNISMPKPVDQPQTNAPIVDLSAIPKVKFHYNSNIKENVKDPSINIYQGRLYAKRDTGLILLEYLDNENQRIGFEVVDVRSFNEFKQMSLAAIGEELQPFKIIPENPVAPVVTKGLDLLNAADAYVYQHENSASAQNGDVFAIKKTLTGEDIQIYWRKKGLADIVWPYELHYYKAEWPSDEKKYQIYVRGSTKEAKGVDVELPAELKTQLMPFQEPSQHATLEGNIFSTDISTTKDLDTEKQLGWSLLQYLPGNDVAFQVVKSVVHDQIRITDTTVIGEEINIDKKYLHGQGPAPSNKPGYVYVKDQKENNPKWDRYDSVIYSGTTSVEGTGQIFPVNAGSLEVWWYNLDDKHNVQWPSKSVGYNCNWPDDCSNIIIASQKGSALGSVKMSDFGEPQAALDVFKALTEKGYIKGTISTSAFIGEEVTQEARMNQLKGLMEGYLDFVLKKDALDQIFVNSFPEKKDEALRSAIKEASLDLYTRLIENNFIRIKISEQDFENVVLNPAALMNELKKKDYINDNFEVQKSFLDLKSEADFKVDAKFSADKHTIYEVLKNKCQEAIFKSFPSATDFTEYDDSKKGTILTVLTMALSSGVVTPKLIETEVSEFPELNKLKRTAFVQEKFKVLTDPAQLNISGDLSMKAKVFDILKKSYDLQTDHYVNWSLYYQNDSSLPGFNPNDEHALIAPVNGKPTIFALRDDLYIEGNDLTSKPYVLMKYQNPDDLKWSFRVFKVEASTEEYPFTYPMIAGQRVSAPYPLETLGICKNTFSDSKESFRDRKNQYWARSATGISNAIVMNYYYKNQPDFYYPPGYTAQNYIKEGEVPFLNFNKGDNPSNIPKPVFYTVYWPDDETMPYPLQPKLLPNLRVGETLVKQKFGLPNICEQSSAAIIYQQTDDVKNKPIVKLIDPTRSRSVKINAIPDDVQTEISKGMVYFPTLPPHLKKRFYIDPTDPANKRLIFKGEFVEAIGAEEPKGYVLLNTLSKKDRDLLETFSKIQAYKDVIGNLITNLTLMEIDDQKPVFDTLALTAGDARAKGYVTLAFGNSSPPSGVSEPISLEIIKVGGPYRGEIKAIESDNPFDEQITLRHTGDFAGNVDDFIFEWRSASPDKSTGKAPNVNPENNGEIVPGWEKFEENNENSNDITISPLGKSAIFCLKDNYFICRFRPNKKNIDSQYQGAWGFENGDYVWSDWTEPMLAQGWIKRVLNGIEPFEQRIKNLETSEVDTTVSMISQSGARWIGNVAFNLESAKNNGLIEIYESVLKRGLEIVNGAKETDSAVNDALLLAAGRISDLYMLLGNEAYADACDPTIAFGTEGQYGAEASSIHCFMNQTSSLLEEELALLRGRDDNLMPSIHTYPFYNKLIWNFTNDINGGEVAYALNYNIRDENGDIEGRINEDDARKLYPQGHGDAWGHYLTALKGYYAIMSSTYFEWEPRIEAVLVAGVPVNVDYLDERKFAKSAASKAKIGAEILNLTYRAHYTENPNGQWQGYKDSNPEKAWGVSEWAQRAGQGAFLDWVVANALLPDKTIEGAICSRYFSEVVKDHQHLFDVLKERVVVELLDEKSDSYKICKTYKAKKYTDRRNDFESYFLNDPFVTQAEAQAAFNYLEKFPLEKVGGAIPSAHFSGIVGDYVHLFEVLNNKVVKLIDPEQFLYAFTETYRSKKTENRELEFKALFTNDILISESEAQAAFNLLESYMVDETSGIQRINRWSVPEIESIADHYEEIQSELDNADSGLNPLGLAKNALPFDIDPAGISQGKTHFEQIYERAVSAMNNAIAVFNHASNTSQMLRRQSDSVDEFKKSVETREADFNSRLIELYGTPYTDDIGPTGIYESGYEGPDLYHFVYVDKTEITGLPTPPTRKLTLDLKEYGVKDDGTMEEKTVPVTFNVDESTLEIVKPKEWTGVRASPGEIQRALSSLMQQRMAFEKDLKTYENLITDIVAQSEMIEKVSGINAQMIEVISENNHEQKRLSDLIRRSAQVAKGLKILGSGVKNIGDALAEALPTSVGFSIDATSSIRGVLKSEGSLFEKALSLSGVAQEVIAYMLNNQKEEKQFKTDMKVRILGNEKEMLSYLKQLEQQIRQEDLQRYQLAASYDAIIQAENNYRSVLAKGQRLLSDRTRFRKQTASKVQGYRYHDMAFRIFRNDTLQKYRAQFDLAAKYVYLAAKAYDYETNLLPGDERGPGETFFNEIVKSRALGQIVSGIPQTGAGFGDPGLADPLARMSMNWNLIIKGQLGFNNPQTETGRFSLRSEHLRILPGQNGDKTWRETLARSVVDNLFDIPEFKRYCIPFAPHLAEEPGIVIEFATDIHFGENFFGRPLSGGDNAYDSTHFATKIRSQGVWFSNYNNLGEGISNTPRIYLIPVGKDLLRSPTDNSGSRREWQILDQKLPVPFPLSQKDLTKTDWMPSLNQYGDFIDIRKYPAFRAYHDSGSFNTGETISNSRLIGRSVANSRWLLIIPAGTLHVDRKEGLNRFIHGQLKANSERDGNGVKDIKLFFQTYSFSGN